MADHQSALEPAPTATSGAAQLPVYRFGHFRLCTSQRVVERDGTLVPLCPKVVDVLMVLVRHAGKIVDKDTLLREVWPGTFVAESGLTRNISVLRKALDEPDSAQSVIQTVSKRGYRFAAPIEEEVPTPATAAPVRPPVRRWPLAAALVALVLLAAAFAPRQPDAPPSTLTEADRQYLLGRHMWGKLERTEVQKALARFQKAAAIDPDSALAHAGVADAYVMMTTLGLGRPSVNLTQARTAALRAVQLQPKLARPHVSLGQVRVLADFDWAGAEREFRRAIELEPHSAVAHHGYACLLAHSGRFAEARASVQRAQQLDPVSPVIGITAVRIEYFARQYQRAIELLRELLEREPSLSQAHYYMAMSLGELGRPGEALQHLHQARLHPGLLASEEAWLHTLTGDRNPARKLVAERAPDVASGAQSATVLMLPAVDAGDHNLALRALEDMAKARAIELVSLLVNPRLDPLRSDPRFAAVQRSLWPRLAASPHALAPGSDSLRLIRVGL